MPLWVPPVSCPHPSSPRPGGQGSLHASNGFATNDARSPGCIPSLRRSDTITLGSSKIPIAKSNSQLNSHRRKVETCLTPEGTCDHPRTDMLQMRSVLDPPSGLLGAGSMSGSSPGERPEALLGNPCSGSDSRPPRSNQPIPNPRRCLRRKGLLGSPREDGGSPRSTTGCGVAGRMCG